MHVISPASRPNIFEIFKSAEQKEIEQEERAWKMSELEAFKRRIYSASDAMLAYEWTKYNKEINDLEACQNDAEKIKLTGSKARLQYLLRILPYEQRVIEQEAGRRNFYLSTRLFQNRPVHDKLHAWELSSKEHADILTAWGI